MKPPPYTRLTRSRLATCLRLAQGGPLNAPLIYAGAEAWQYAKLAQDERLVVPALCLPPGTVPDTLDWTAALAGFVPAACPWIVALAGADDAALDLLAGLLFAAGCAQVTISYQDGSARGEELYLNDFEESATP